MGQPPTRLDLSHLMLWSMERRMTASAADKTFEPFHQCGKDVSDGWYVIHQPWQAPKHPVLV